MKKMKIVLIMLSMILASMAFPSILAEETSIDITVSTNETLNMTIQGNASDGTLEVWVNGIRLVKPVSTAGLWAAIYELRDSNGQLLGNLMMLANETGRNFRVLFNNDAILAGQLGTFSDSDLAEAIRNGNTTIVKQLIQLEESTKSLEIFLKSFSQEYNVKLADLEAFLRSLDMKLYWLEAELAPKFNVTNIKVEPREVEPGKEVTIMVEVTNTGSLLGTYNLSNIKVINEGDVETISGRQVTLGGGRSETLEFKFTPGAEGSYSVEVEGLRDSFTAKVPRIYTGYIAGILIIFAAAVASVYAIYRRGRLNLGASREHGVE
jgi:hypothetical protein